MHEHGEIVLSVAREIRHHRFARFGGIPATTAKAFRLEHLPAIRRHELVLRVEGEQLVPFNTAATPAVLALTAHANA